MAHIGFTPQSEHALGGYRVQGRGDAADRVLRGRARGAGGGRVRGRHGDGPRRRRHARSPRSSTIPTIGIGAGQRLRRPGAGLAGRLRSAHRPDGDVREAVRRRPHGAPRRRPGLRRRRRRPAPSPVPSTPSESRASARATVADMRLLLASVPLVVSAWPAPLPPIAGTAQGPWPPPPSRAPRRPRQPEDAPAASGEGDPAARGDQGRHRPGHPVGRPAAARAARSWSPSGTGPGCPWSPAAAAARWATRATGVGLGRDRADVDRGRPGLRRQPPDLHLPGRLHGLGHGRARHRLADQRQADPGDQAPGPALRAAGDAADATAAAGSSSTARPAR